MFDDDVSYGLAKWSPDLGVHALHGKYLIWSGYVTGATTIAEFDDQLVAEHYYQTLVKGKTRDPRKGVYNQFLRMMVEMQPDGRCQIRHNDFEDYFAEIQAPKLTPEQAESVKTLIKGCSS
jgi:hypothetical protein